ncbi:MAG: response regulator, partial [Rhodospirillales bacterium]|nr:response regulator [Rhodospirillales bacterium]
MAYQLHLDSYIATCPILVVDDQLLIRRLIEALLKKAGFDNIEFAENGVEALEKIASLKPACVILDVNMPVMDGIETLA